MPALAPLNARFFTPPSPMPLHNAAGFDDVPVARSRWHCWYCAGAKGFKHPTSKVQHGGPWACPAMLGMPHACFLWHATP